MSEMGLAGLQSGCLAGLSPSAVSAREYISQSFPAPRGCLHSLTPGPFLSSKPAVVGRVFLISSL